MKTTIDRAGRLVIPKPLRDELGLRGGEDLNITLRNGRIEIEPASKKMRLIERRGFLAAEIESDEVSPLTTNDVRELLERLRR
ncbi:MAG: AbrB/MazE/SpoVT family DNA-binding domain-containing protein [Chloroflexi bacterium]|nr:AbrB/MazE/SpoVT family DNA-binding domain-containing protein [Chloroflexota bacterium]